jgi:hypothetical protein
VIFATNVSRCIYHEISRYARICKYLPVNTRSRRSFGQSAQRLDSLPRNDVQQKKRSVVIFVAILVPMVPIARDNLISDPEHGHEKGR